MVLNKRQIFSAMVYLVLFWSIVYPKTIWAEFVFSVSPGFQKSKAEEMYEPLMRYMEKILGDRVVFDYPQDWKEYGENMRKGRYDIVFDAPHFSSWRIKNIKHTPVARLPGQMGYLLVTNGYDTSINKLRDLVGVRICSQASPSLSNMTVYRLFENPVHMPQVYEINSDYRGVYKALRKGLCAAAVFRDLDYERLRPSLRRSLRIIVRSEPVPERTITISDRLATKKRLLARMLISNEGAKAAQPVFQQFGKKEQTFVKVEPKEYQGLDKLLSHVVWGW